MRTCWWLLTALCLAVCIMLPGPARADDTDGDGLPDHVEARLGTDPQVAEVLEVVGEDYVTDVEEGTEGRHDIARLLMANVARGRWLWAIEFAEPHDPDNTIVTLYVDADCDPLTGRPAMGCEVAYTHLGGRPYSETYVPAGEEGNYPGPRVAIVEGVFYICADAPLRQLDGRTRIRARIHCQTIRPALVRDRWGFMEIDGPGDSEPEVPLAQQKAAISGTVLHEHQPVAGALVRAVPGRPEGNLDPFTGTIEATTADDGTFAIPVTPGPWMVTVTKGMLTSDEGYGSPQYCYVSDGEVEDLPIGLDLGGGIRGTVVSAQTGEAVPGGRVITLGAFGVRCDEGGNFTLEGLAPGLPKAIAACAEGMAWRSLSVEVAQGEMTEQRIELEPGYCVRGTVRDDQGNPVEGAQVTVALQPTASAVPMMPTATWWPCSALSDAEGCYAVAGLAYGQQIRSVLVRHPAYAAQEREQVATPPPGTDAIELDFILDRGSAIMGKVTGPDGGGVPGAELRFRGGSRGGYVKTDATGHFTIDRIADNAPGYLVVQFEMLAPQAIEVTPGKDDTMPWLDIVMQPGHTARGKIVDRQDRPVAGARVTPHARFLDGAVSCYVSQAGGTASDGTFLLGSLPAEAVMVDVTFDGRTVADDHPLQVDGETTIVIDRPQ